MTYLLHILAGALGIVSGFVTVRGASGRASARPPSVESAYRALPVLAVMVTMFYWLWRVRVRRTFRGIVGIRASESGASPAAA